MLHDYAIASAALRQRDPPFANVVAHRLLNVDMLAGLRSPDGHQGMPVVGRGDGDCVQVLVVQSLANISNRLRFVSSIILFCDVLESSRQHFLVRVDDVGHFNIRLIHPTLKVTPTSAIHATDANVQSIIRTHGFPRRARAKDHE